MAQKRQRTSAAPPAAAPQRPALQEISQFMLLEREVEIQYRPLMLAALQDKVNTVADSLRDQTPACSRCSQPMKRHDTETVSWIARFGSSPWQHMDDTGTRVDGANHHCQILCNPLYGAYFTTAHKDRLTIIDVLRNGRPAGVPHQ